MIKATVRYTSEHYKALYKTYDGKIRNKRLFWGALCLIFLLFYTWYALSYCIGCDFGGLSLIVIVICALCWTRFIRTFMKNAEAKRELKNMAPVRELRHFVFDDVKFCMLCEREGFYLDQRIHYTELVSARESGDYFFIMVEQGKVCIIAKTELTEGTPEELRALLMEKLRDKFILDD